MLMNQELLAEYDYLDELDCRGWAWEILRRIDQYREDYRRLQKEEGPESFNSEHESLAQKWHVRCMLSPDSREVPEFFHERYQNIPRDLMGRICSASPSPPWGDSGPPWGILSVGASATVPVLV